MSHKIHSKHKVRVKAGQKFRHDDLNPEQWSCPVCHRTLPTRWTLCRKRRNCPGRVRQRLLKGLV